MPFKIGSTKTPSVAPIFAIPAANPLAVARSSVGNEIGANVNVVELAGLGIGPKLGQNFGDGGTGRSGDVRR